MSRNSCQLSLADHEMCTERSLDISDSEVWQDESHVVQAGVQYGGVVSEKWEDHDQHGFVLSKIPKISYKLILRSQCLFPHLRVPSLQTRKRSQ